MYYPFSWLKTLSRLALYFLAVSLFGLYVDKLPEALALGAFLLLVMQYWSFYRLNRWLWHSKKMTPPKTRGIWEHIYEGIYYLQRRNRNKRKELGALVKRFREGAEALPDAAVVVDANACIVWCNRLARIELGLCWPDDAGRRIDNLIRHPQFIQFFHDGEYSYPIEVISPTNIDKVLEYRIMPYGDKHLLLVARDVTRVSQLEEMRKDFVANVSHELRTPLTVLNGYLEMFGNEGDHYPPAFMQKAFTEMTAQTRRMQSLIEQLLILSRIEASAERVYEKIVDVPMVLSAIKSEAATLNQAKQHEIEFDVDKDLKVFGIETELRSAFSNLIFNAIHYTPKKGKIRVTWKLVNKMAEFAVEDNGDGIAEKHLSRLTERFYRVDKARSRKTGGSGLGLAIVKHVLTHHNSKLEIESEVGKGSRFSFHFSSELTVVNSHAGKSE
ncbi:phosphate regulon sensor histidine kinase PhoR [Aliiglaciecola sp. CAU 1673]|uniref:phosphate regulon sensor histidine kinase PhoR n=1 Tax=Aliiglaciecola sp. CAU 1673 TaxID=3032595 RepID=UPI0023D9E60A|nr:phosphate regulon sensor histidine kinase PhoR [Aliiglaciecola sp. CAU 1673]MDF2180054.1 phosphate regulon sensor histidine kinase PhoR [Aliiglaciecola sp. CAU 1673]